MCLDLYLGEVILPREEAVVAWKSLTVGNGVDGSVLCSPHYAGTVWREKEQRAQCNCYGLKAPAYYEHLCGLYARHTRNGAIEELGVILAKVLVWGRIQVYSNGVRAEHLEIVRLKPKSSASPEARETLSAVREVLELERRKAWFMRRSKSLKRKTRNPERLPVKTAA